jgi:hypothetical protein
MTTYYLHMFFSRRAARALPQSRDREVAFLLPGLGYSISFVNLIRLQALHEDRAQALAAGSSRLEASLPVGPELAGAPARSFGREIVRIAP